MAAKSKHYGDVANWILDVIKSCTHPVQEIVAHKLMAQFRIEYCNIDPDVLIALNRKMQQACEQKQYLGCDFVIRKF